MRTLHRYGTIVQYNTLLYSLVDIFFIEVFHALRITCRYRQVGSYKGSSEVLLVFAHRAFMLIVRIWPWGNPTNFKVFILHFNPLNAEFNTICHLLALLGAHHILYVSRIRVKLKVCCLELGRSLADQTLFGARVHGHVCLLCIMLSAWDGPTFHSGSFRLVWNLQKGFVFSKLILKVDSPDDRTVLLLWCLLCQNVTN
jgi:hypothetical protein